MPYFYDFRKHIGHKILFNAYGYDGVVINEKHIPKNVGFGVDPVKQIKVLCLTCKEVIGTIESHGSLKMEDYFLHDSGE